MADVDIERVAADLLRIAERDDAIKRLGGADEAVRIRLAAERAAHDLWMVAACLARALGQYEPRPLPRRPVLPKEQWHD